MQTVISSNGINPTSSKLKFVTNRHGKKLSEFYAKFLESWMRKTEADRRVELFGSDPFK